MQRLSLRTQLLIGIAVMFFIAVGGIGLLNYITASRMLLETNKEHTDAALDFMHVYAQNEIIKTVKSFLSGKTTAFAQTIRYTYNLVSSRQMKERDALLFIKKALLAVRIGKTGYMAVIDGKGHIVFHPKLPAGTDLSSHAFIQETLQKKEGLVFYSWQNPDEPSPREKVLYVSSLPERDWYVCSTAYIEDFEDKLDITIIQETLRTVGVLTHSHVFLVSKRGTIIASSAGQQGRERKDSLITEEGFSLAKRVAEIGNGFLSYHRTNEEGRVENYHAHFRQIPYIGWITVSEASASSLSEQLRQFRFLNISVIFVSAILIIVIGFWMTSTFTRSIQNIQNKLSSLSSRTEKADLSQRIEIYAHNEIGKMANFINQFLERVNRDFLSVRKTSEQLKESSTKSQEIMESLIEAKLESIKNKIIQINYSTENATSGIEELTANLEEMSRSIQSIMNNMERQASSVEESASSIEEMVRNIENITTTTMKSQNISTNLNNVAQEGGEAVKQAIFSIKEVADYSQQIMKMLQIISNIAKQTNLLAMNAAIEAAHAGEAGKGFAIVAEEIRRLSEDTNKNAREIGETINVIVERINNSVNLSEKAGIGLDMIMAYSQQNVQIANQITLAMSEQTHGAKEILSSTHDLVKITEEVKLAITEQNTATHDFNDAIRGLRDVSLENQTIIAEHLNDLNNLISGLADMKNILNEVVSQSSFLDNLLEKFIFKDEVQDQERYVIES